MTSEPTQMRVGAGLSADPDVSLATANACTQAQASLGGERPSLVVVFYSLHHRDQGHRIASVIRRMLNPVHVIGCSAESVVGGGTELERTPGLSILAACMPGVTFTPFTEADLPPPDDANETAIAAAVGMTDQWRATLLLADPFSVPMIRLLPALNRAKGSLGGVVVGGMASAGKAAGMNSLILDERLKRSGAVGISLSGPVRVDTVLSQGCRPFGPNLVVTRAKGNLIFELGGQSAIDAVQAAVNTLDAKQRKGLSDGLFMGVAINASKPRLGRDDFLIRNVMGVRPQEGAIAVGDIVPVGATIRLHARDATTAREDLALLMDLQKLYDRPRGVLLITCNGRGERLFHERHTDARAVAKAFATPMGGESLAKGGMPFDSEPLVPLAGFFAAGEIGPIGGECFLHGQAACAVMLREV
ncbi:MAG: FIST C-terminal domain-containing protein [Phycisphaerales bacterium]|nr:FIST C-terminal domain-containing protein [Phycisphaerales bacterium]